LLVLCWCCAGVAGVSAHHFAPRAPSISSLCRGAHRRRAAGRLGERPGKPRAHAAVDVALHLHTNSPGRGLPARCPRTVMPAVREAQFVRDSRVCRGAYHTRGVSEASLRALATARALACSSPLPQLGMGSIAFLAQLALLLAPGTRLYIRIAHMRLRGSPAACRASYVSLNLSPCRCALRRRRQLCPAPAVAAVRRQGRQLR
jgi:hypothetical protein